MDKYRVRLFARAYRDLDSIYTYIAETLQEPGTAEKMAAVLEDAIYSLESFPERGSLRKTGIYANQGYRQLFVKNYVIIYRVQREEKEVYIVTIRYSPNQF